MKGRKGCWTCTARKIRCDGGRPGCQRCARSRRECQGYEFRLSWPRNNDKKRAMTSASPPVLTTPYRGTGFPFINTTWQDVELYRHLYPQIQPLYQAPPTTKSWKPAPGTIDYMELVQYFHYTAHLSLVTFTTRTSQIRDALIRMALVSDSLPARAVLYALLAYSSLHFAGLQQQAVQLKVSAIQFLSASARAGTPGADEAAQLVAASMLLGGFEILLPSDSSGEWLWYVRGAMDTVLSTHIADQSHESDVGQLISWVYYHDALSRFAMHHWHRKSLAPRTTEANDSEPRGLQYPNVARHRPVPPSPIPEHAILNLLSDICDTVVEPGDPKRYNEVYQDRLNAFERRLSALPTTPTSAKPDRETKLVGRLYQTATRIYLIRASQRLCQLSTELEPLVEETFAAQIQASECPSCAHFFPLFIMACEARTEEHRYAILSLIERNERSVKIRSMKGLREGIRSMWVQQDLHADEDLLVDYLDVMSVAISSSYNTLPSFV